MPRENLIFSGKSSSWRVDEENKGRHHTSLRLGQFLLSAMSVWFLSGCAAVFPVPSFTTKPECGQKLTTRDIAFIQPGKTTRDEVILNLGNDYKGLPQDKAFAYTWEIPGGNGIWILASLEAGAAGEFEWSHWRGFFLAFDEQGVVTAKAFKRLWSRHSLDEQLSRWFVKKFLRSRAKTERESTRNYTPQPDPLPIGWGEGTNCKVIADTGH